MSMAERILFEVIQDGLEWYTEDPRRFERFLTTNMGLSEAEAAKARTYFAGDATATPPQDARPPTLIHGYARTGGPFPCWALTLGAESISTDYLGKDASFLDSDGENYVDIETGDVVDPKVRRMQYRFDILVLADHPDITVYYYHLLKTIVMSSQDVLESRHVEELLFEGADMAPDARYLPDDVFIRRFSVTVFGDECWDEQIVGGRGRSVTGIHLSEDGSEDVAGSVTAKAKVTVYNAGADD